MLEWITLNQLKINKNHSIWNQRLTGKRVYHKTIILWLQYDVTAKNTTILNKHQTLGIVVLITCFIPSQQHRLIPFLHFP